MNRTPQEISRDSVNGRQLGYIIINTLIGSGVYVLPGLLAKGAGHDGWLLTLLITLIPIIYTLLICTFLKRSERSFADAMKDMMGKAGWIVRALYALMLTLFCIVALKTMSELIGTNMLPRTPNIIIEAVMMLCVLYAASKGMKVIGRINIVLFVCFICLAAAFILSIDKADFRNVLPISDLSGWNDPVYAVFAAMSFFIGLEVLYTFHPSVKNKDRGRNYAVLGVLASGVGFAVINFACVLVFGEYMLSDIGYSSMLLLRSSTNGLFIRLFFTLLFFNLMLIKPLINCGYAASSAILELAPPLKKKPWITLLVWGLAVVVTASLLPPADELEILYIILLVFGGLYGLLLPVMGLIKYRSAKKRSRASAKSGILWAEGKK